MTKISIEEAKTILHAFLAASPMDEAAMIASMCWDDDFVVPDDVEIDALAARVLDHFEACWSAYEARGRGSY